MKPAPFKYFAPDSLSEALGLLSEHADDAKLLAGGQSLIPTMNFRLAQPAVLIDLNNVSELDFLEAGRRGRTRIGAMCRQRAIEKSDLIASNAPLLSETMPNIAHPQIRNRGTIGGSIVHADPAAELPTITAALGTRFRLQNSKGDRWIDSKEFFTGMFGTALNEDEILVEIEVPSPEKRTGSAFLEIARRHGDYALVGAAAIITLDRKGRIDSGTLAYLSVGDGPVFGTQAVSTLKGEYPSEDLFANTAEIAASTDTSPHSDIHASADYRRQLVRTLTKRTLKIAAARAAS